MPSPARAASSSASKAARFLSTRPGWMAAQRWVLGGALGLLAPFSVVVE